MQTYLSSSPLITPSLVHPTDFERPIWLNDSHPRVSVDDDPFFSKADFRQRDHWWIAWVRQGIVGVEREAIEWVPASSVTVASVELLTGWAWIAFADHIRDDPNMIHSGLGM
jgi:hypothetical protein